VNQTDYSATIRLVVICVFASRDMRTKMEATNAPVSSGTDCQVLFLPVTALTCVCACVVHGHCSLIIGEFVTTSHYAYSLVRFLRNCDES